MENAVPMQMEALLAFLVLGQEFHFSQLMDREDKIPTVHGKGIEGDRNSYK